MWARSSVCCYCLLKVVKENIDSKNREVKHCVLGGTFYWHLLASCAVIQTPVDVIKQVENLLTHLKRSLLWHNVVKEEAYLQNELLIDVALRNAGLEVWILKKAQQKFVDKLEKKKKGNKMKYALCTMRRRKKQYREAQRESNVRFLLACEAMKPLEWVHPPLGQNLGFHLVPESGICWCRSVEKRRTVN